MLLQVRTLNTPSRSWCLQFHWIRGEAPVGFVVDFTNASVGSNHVSRMSISAPCETTHPNMTFDSTISVSLVFRAFIRIYSSYERGQSPPVPSNMSSNWSRTASHFDVSTCTHNFLHHRRCPLPWITYIFDSFDGAPPVTFATRRFKSSILRSSSCLVSSFLSFVRKSEHLTLT